MGNERFGARRCVGCGHIETKQVCGPFSCASCGSAGFTAYTPPSLGHPAGLWEEAGVPSAGRADYECLRCGGKVASPQESRYCPKCERYLGLTD